MLCKKCNRELPDGSTFCCWCGAKQAAPQKRKALKRANGTGTVYKLQGRRKRPWVASKSKVVIGYYETKTSALEALNRLTGRSLDERYNMTFAEVFEAWKSEHYKEITDAGRSSYNRAYDVFAPLHGKKFRDLRAADFQAVLDPYMGQSHSTLSKHKQLITQMSAWAMREELISTNFAAFVRLPENIKKEKEVFSESDIEKLEADGSETAKIILMLIYTGMRAGGVTFCHATESNQRTRLRGHSPLGIPRGRQIAPLAVPSGYLVSHRRSPFTRPTGASPGVYRAKFPR